MNEPALHTPHALGDFTILGVLGEGGSGTVYHARWGHREVALKVLRGDLGDGERERFLTEARLLIEMTHPAVVKVLAAGTLPDGRPYLAMERLPGETLAHRLRGGALLLPRAVSLFGQICDAVAAMHARSLIHRDLKPENVMLVDGPGGEHAVLLDFGIAKTADGGVAAPTQSGLVRGTPAYMAPERFFGNPASVSTDVYELAVMFFAMVAGRLPWADCADPEVRLNPARLADVAVVPAALDEIIARALSTRAPNRPPTVVALSAAIASAAGVAVQAIAAAAPPMTDRETRPLHTASSGSSASSASSPPSASSSGDRISNRPYVDPAAETSPAMPAQGLQPWADGGKATTTTGQAATGERERQREQDILTLPVRRRRWPWAVAAVVLVIGGVTAAGIIASSGRGVVAMATDDPWSSDRKLVPAPIDAPPLPRIVAADREAVRAELADAFRYLSPDAHLAGGVALEEMRGTPELHRLLDGLHEKSKLSVLASFAIGPCAFELVGKTRWVAFASIGDPATYDLVARGTWYRSEVEACLDDHDPTKVERKKVKGRDGTPISVIQTVVDQRVIGWIDDHTLFVSTRPNADVAFVTARLDAHEGNGPRSKVVDLGVALDRRSTAWLVGDRAELSSLFANIPALQRADATARFEFTDRGDLRFEIVTYYADETAAEEGRAAIEEELSTITDSIAWNLATDFTIRRDGTAARFHGTIPADLVEKMQDAVLKAAH